MVKRRTSLQLSPYDPFVTSNDRNVLWNTLFDFANGVFHTSDVYSFTMDVVLQYAPPINQPRTRLITLAKGPND